MSLYQLNTAAADRRELLFLPLGGAGEIGMNLNLFGYDGRWLMVDLGVTFGDDSQPVDVIMPDPSFIADRRQDLAGLVLTHAHEDHVGAVPYLWPRLRCPVYCTPFTASVLRRKLGEAGLLREVPIHEVPLGGSVDIHPFKVEFITLTHSIPEPNALAIRTPAGTLLHTGDWKFDPEPLLGEPTDFNALRRVGDEGVLALIGDSTNVFTEGESGSEATVRETLTRLIGESENRVAVACFASNVARLTSVYHAAAAHGRKVALVGRSLRKMDESARENGYLKDIPRFLTEEEGAQAERDEVVLLCTGSQGEPRAALARIANGDHPHVYLEEGDTVIFSSRVIPGNEKSIGRLQDKLVRAGVEIITDADDDVHVSGHPARNELARMYGLIRPKIAVPVHGELRHLHEHAFLAEECQVPTTLVVENGDVVKLAPGTPAIIDKVASGRLALDGNRLVPLSGPSIRQRQRMTQNGLALATLVLSAAGGLVADPVLSLHGLVDAESAEDQKLVARARDAVRAAVEDLDRNGRRDDAVVKDVARLALRRALTSAIGLKPVTEVQVVRV
jgi:ribonuclease J